MKPSLDAAPELKTHGAQMRQQARRLRINGLIMLIACAPLIFFGAYVFLTAGSITTKDYEMVLQQQRQQLQEQQQQQNETQTQEPLSSEGQVALANRIILTAAITRFGTVTLLIFTVSILLSVYRYVMKLAAYYDARADALTIMTLLNDVEAVTFCKIVTALAAEKIDFGKTASIPGERLADLIKSAKAE